MKIIDILTLLAENKPVPMMLKHKSMILTYDPIQHDYKDQKGNYLFMKLMQYKDKCLNDEIEILKIHKVEPIVEPIKMIGCNVEIEILGTKQIFGTDTPIATEHCIGKINEIINYINHSNIEEVDYYYNGGNNE